VGGAVQYVLPCLPVSVEIINTLNNAARFKTLQWALSIIGLRIYKQTKDM